jgi:Tol biopolymer transport system component
VISADGTGKRLLTDGREWIDEPSWSPDGTRIAFDCPGGICLMTPTHPGSRRIVAPGGSAPAWAPDGNRIVFTRVTGESPVWGVDAAVPAYGLSVLDTRSGEIRHLS